MKDIISKRTAVHGKNSDVDSKKMRFFLLKKVFINLFHFNKD